MTGIWRIQIGDETRLARGAPAEGPRELLSENLSLNVILASPAGALDELILESADGPVPEELRPLLPLENQEIWAAGVTFQRSREARKEESRSPDPYDDVYNADRPELFFKAAPGRARGPGEPIGIRADSSWNVPEPELGLVANSAGTIVAYIIGNDVSSRSIEGENPLYLPQAKVYTGSCALGPCLVPIGSAPSLSTMEIELTVHRDGRDLYNDVVAVSQMRRRPEELVSWLFRAMEFPTGVVLLTGTAIVPPKDFTLQPGDQVTIAVEGLGALTNPVVVVGV